MASVRRRGVASRGGDGGFQIVDGFGATSRGLAHPDLWWDGSGAVPTLSTPQRDEIFDTLYSPATGIGLTRARTVDSTIPPGDVRAFVYQASQGAAFTWTRADNEAAYFALAKARFAGLQTFESPIFKEAWMSGHTSTTPAAQDVTDWADWLFAVAARYAAQGAALSHLSIGNEPSYARHQMSGQFVRDAIKNIGPRLVTAGLCPSGIVLPDDIRPTSAVPVIDTVMADATARQYVTAIASHSYDEAELTYAQVAAKAATWGLPLWQTELGKSTLTSMPGSDASDLGWAIACHNMLALYGAAAVDYQVGAFGQQVSDSLVSLNYAAGVYSGLTIKRCGYYMGQFARYIRPGMRRVAISTSDSAVKVTAWRNGAVRTVVAINTTGGSLAPTLVSEVFGKVASLAVVRSSAAENWAAQTAQTTTGGNTIAPTLPASSVTTFTATASN